MSIRKSIIEEVELENGQTFYIQYSSFNNQATISFDGPDMSFQIRVQGNEVNQIIAAMQIAQGEKNESN